MKVSSGPALLDLIRWQGRSLRGHYDGVVGLEQSLLAADRAGVPVEFRAAALVALRAAAARKRFKHAGERREYQPLLEFHETEIWIRCRTTSAAWHHLVR